MSETSSKPIYPHVGKLVGCLAGGVAASQHYWLAVAVAMILGCVLDYLFRYDQENPPTPVNSKLFDMSCPYDLRLGGKASPLVQAAFFRVLFTSLGRIVVSDPALSATQMAYTESLMHRLGLNAQLRQKALAYFHEGRDLECDLMHWVRSFLAVVRQSQLRKVYLETLLENSFVAGEISPKVKSLLHSIASNLKIDAAELNEMLQFQKGRSMAKSARERIKAESAGTHKNEKAQAETLGLFSFDCEMFVNC